MPRMRSSFRGRSRAPRRGVEWIGAARSGAGALFVTVPVTGFDTWYAVLPSQARSYVNPTLVRTRGQAVFSPGLAAGIQSNIVGAVGIIAWSDADDLLPSAAELPDPYNDPDLDWIWHSYLHVPGGGVAGENDLTFSDGVGNPIDSRAMRKLGADQGVMVVVRNESTVQSFSYALGLRCLIKE